MKLTIVIVCTWAKTRPSTFNFKPSKNKKENNKKEIKSCNTCVNLCKIFFVVTFLFLLHNFVFVNFSQQIVYGQTNAYPAPYVKNLPHVFQQFLFFTKQLEKIKIVVLNTHYFCKDKNVFNFGVFFVISFLVWQNCF